MRACVCMGVGVRSACERMCAYVCACVRACVCVCGIRHCYYICKVRYHRRSFASHVFSYSFVHYIF